jgi:DNA-binding CsgD family transcriptional regulator
MSITTDRIAKANGIGRGKTPLDAVAKSHLFDALVGTLDNIAIGIVIVAEQGRIMHANHAAREMLAAKSPIMALGNCLCALQSERTKELRQAIATAQTDPASISPSGIGVPLIDKSMNAATAHVLALVSPTNQAQPLNMQAPVAVFVTPPSIVPPIETGAVARLFKLTPAEARLLAQLVSGASLAEAALNLGIAEATARTHRNHVFTKTGVSRRADLIVLVGRLLPPIRRTH